MLSADLVTYAEEIRNGKLQFLCSVRVKKKLQNSDLIYYSVRLMTDVFKIIIVKYRWKIIAKYRLPSGNRA